MISAAVAVFHGPGRPFEQRRIDVTGPRPGQILVRVTACTICGSDLHNFTGRRPTPTPVILGHEAIGRIVDFAAGAPRLDARGAQLQPGDRITWSAVASCGNCFYCNRALPQKCEQSLKYGHTSLMPGRELTGGLAEFCLLHPGTTIVRLRGPLPDATACPANCATATAAAAIASLGPLCDRVVLVTGAGLFGLTASAMARDAGARVICFEPNPQRRELCQHFGAATAATTDEIAALARDVTSGRGVDAFLELSGAPEAFESMFPLVRAGGTLALAGAVFPSRPVSLSMESIVRRNLRFVGIHNYAPGDLVAAVGFLESLKAPVFEGLVARWFPLSDVDEAFAFASTSGAIRVGVRQ